MAPGENGKISEEEADFAKASRVRWASGFDHLTASQAFQELATGEQTATALENHLTALEARIEALLAQANDNQNIAEERSTIRDTQTNKNQGDESIETDSHANGSQ